MAKLFFLTSKTMKTILCFFLLAITIGCANSARILDEASSEFIETDEPDVAPVVAPAATLPTGQVPATTASTPVVSDTVDPPADIADTVTTPASNTVTPAATTAAIPVVSDKVDPHADEADTVTAPASNTATPAATPVVGNTVDPPADVADTVTAPASNTVTPVATTAGGAAGAGSGTVGNGNQDHPGLSFYMHDILGGSNPSGRVVTGVVADTDAGGLPFSSPSNPVFPISGGVPLNTINDVIDNNNYPFLVGLNGQPTNTQQGGNSQAFVTAGQLPAGLTLQKLMFGSVTVVDNELTEGYELGSHVIGKAQGFYLASSQDGSSHTLALTALFHSGEHEHELEDTISFFGVHRTATPVSHLAIIGGTGKYENAKGHATIETELRHEDEHTTDGLETITHFTVHITP